jgi:hypothetical protein
MGVPDRHYPSRRCVLLMIVVVVVVHGRIIISAAVRWLLRHI